MITAGGTGVFGRDSIRAVLRQLIETRALAVIEERSMVVAGDVAIATERWTTRFVQSGGGPDHVRVSLATVVLRRVEDTWKLQIADPWSSG